MPKRIEGNGVLEIKQFFEMAAEEARKATCLRAKCGSVIISTHGEIIGCGFNAPPLDDELQRTCDAQWDIAKKPKYDKTCCVHAEWNAVIDMIKRASHEVKDSRLYFMRVDERGNFTDAGVPYCTTCSRFVMQAGVAEFALWNENGADIYTLPEYNKASYEYYSL